jgi:hypothetical protein
MAGMIDKNEAWTLRAAVKQIDVKNSCSKCKAGADVWESEEIAEERGSRRAWRDIL